MPASLPIAFDGKPFTGGTLAVSNAGRVFTVVGGGAKTYKTVHVYGPGRAKPEQARIEPDKQGRYRLPSPLAAGQWSYTARDEGQPNPEPVKFTVATTDSAPDNSGGGKDTSDGWPLGFGACADGDSLAAGTAAKLKAVGVTHVRWFGSGAQDDGSYVGNDAGHAAKVIAAGVTAVVRFGVREANAKKGRPNATPLTEKQLHKYWQGVGAATNKLGSGFVVELENESNLTKYLDFGQQGGVVSPLVVKYDLLNARIARTYLGPSRKIVSSTVGWEASSGVHRDYLKAKLDAGLLDYVNVIGTHPYVGSAARLDEQLGAQRALIGDKPLWATETAVKDNPNLGTIAACVAVYRKHGVLPFWFRGEAEEGEPRWSDAWSILDAQGRPISAVVKALGLVIPA